MQQAKWNAILLDLSKVMTKFQFGVLVLWISFTVLAFSYFITDRLVEFDENNKLENIKTQTLGSYFTHFITQENNKKGNKIIHFSQKDCDCYQSSEAHISDLNRIASANNFDIINVVLDEDDIIPSTPSIAVIGDSGEVIYYGPYGQGVACSQTAGYAQTVLNNYLKGYVSNIIIKNAKGCYCEV